MKSKNKIISIILSFCFMFVFAAGLVGCGKNGNGGNGGDSQNGNGGGSGNGSGSPETVSVSTKDVINQSLDKLESSMSDLAGAESVSYSSSVENFGAESAVIGKPFANKYTNKAQAILKLYDIFECQYEAKYFVNYATIENGYAADFETGKVYRTAYGNQSTLLQENAMVFDQYYSAWQISNGVAFQNEISVSYFDSTGLNGMETTYQKYFECNYDYENQKPLSMNLIIKQISKNKQNGVESKEMGIIIGKVDYTANVVYMLRFSGMFEDYGEAITNKLDNNSYDSENFITESGIKAYLFEKIGLNANADDYYVYESYGTNTEEGIEIDQTFCDRYDEVYNAVKNDMHTKPALDTTNAIDMGNKLYYYMYYYSTQVIDNMDPNGGKITIRTIKELDKIKSILSDLKLELENNSEYNQTTGSTTYNNAREIINSSIEFLSTIDQGAWIGCFNQDRTVELKFNKDAQGYYIQYTVDGGIKQIAFTIDENNEAHLCNYKYGSDNIDFKTSTDN